MSEKLFCPVRKRYFISTPEEIVRQNVLQYLHEELGIAYARMAVERQIGKTKKRFDIIIHDSSTGKPQAIIECKRESINLDQKVFDQISRYNYELNVPYLIITNWREWRAALIEGEQFKMLSSFPNI